MIIKKIKLVQSDFAVTVIPDKKLCATCGKKRNLYLVQVHQKLEVWSHVKENKSVQQVASEKSRIF